MKRLLQLTAILACVLVLFPTGPGASWAAENTQEKDDHHEDEVRVRIYIAIGGAACAGLYWFISYTSGWLPKDTLERPSLLNYNAADQWQWGVPLLRMKESGTGAVEPYMEFVRIRF